MALVKCKECGQEISSTAKKCPNCGVKHPARESATPMETIIGIVIMGAIFLFFYVACGDSESEKSLGIAKRNMMREAGVPAYAFGSASCQLIQGNNPCCAYNARTGVAGERRRTVVCKKGGIQPGGKICKGFDCW